MTQRILFLCTHNSARSQMAQGLLNWLAPDRYQAFSAGTHPSQQHPLAVQVMAELGSNITPQGVHQITDYQGQPFDLVVTVCDSAAEACPVFPGAVDQQHWGFADPSTVGGDEAQRLAAFRHTRDLILVRMRSWLATQSEETASTLVPSVSTSASTTAMNSPVSTTAPIHVLVLCTGNAARSQMGEAWLSFLGGTQFTVVSAGTHPTAVHPLAMQVMAERGIDISGNRSKSVSEFLDHAFDYVITVCDRAAESCPTFPGMVQRLHWSFPDPAAVAGDITEQVQAFREVRDGLYFQCWYWLAHGKPVATAVAE